ncbi:MAG: hypothetical protein ACK5NT_09340 [Pyrinomonadaceae bacterium]
MQRLVIEGWENEAHKEEIKELIGERLMLGFAERKEINSAFAIDKHVFLVINDDLLAKRLHSELLQINVPATIEDEPYEVGSDEK